MLWMVRIQIGSGQGGLPIVCVDDVRREAQILAQLQPGACQKAEALRVVAVVVVLQIMIETRAVEILVGFDEVGRHPAIVRGVDCAPFQLAAHPDPQ